MKCPCLAIPPATRRAAWTSNSEAITTPRQERAAATTSAAANVEEAVGDLVDGEAETARETVVPGRAQVGAHLDQLDVAAVWLGTLREYV